jgi:5-formyltetrahydrofolate cyclo-ligase
VDLATRKVRLRESLSARRRAVPPHVARQAGAAVVARVESLSAFAAAGSVSLYAALPDEVPSRPLFEATRRRGKTALFPRVEGDCLVFAALERWEDLRAGRYGVPEPPAAAPSVGFGDLVLVPGVAFDRRGHRLGRGGGYYDRTFGEEVGRGVVLIGVGYAFQLVAEVPHGLGDRRLDGVVTDEGFFPAEEGVR